MGNLQVSATQRKIEAQLQASVDLLKRAKRYVGQSTTIGGQDLSREITEYVAAYDCNPALPLDPLAGVLDPEQLMQGARP